MSGSAHAPAHRSSGDTEAFSQRAARHEDFVSPPDNSLSLLRATIVTCVQGRLLGARRMGEASSRSLPIAARERPLDANSIPSSTLSNWRL